MNNRFFPYKCTLFNKFKLENGKDDWKKTLLNNCYWQRLTSRSLQGENNVIVGSSVDIMVAKQHGYKSPQEWISSPIGYTFNVGDIIVLGEITDMITGVTGGTVNDILHKYGEDAVTIKACEPFIQPFMMNKHFEIVGW